MIPAPAGTGSALRHRHPWLLLTLAPVLLAQGMHVRRSIPRLPEAAGARAGVAGEGRPLRLLIAGDSAAAGVGVADQSQALAGQLVARLAPDFRLYWRLEAETGRTTRQTVAQLRELAPERFDVAVISLGVNDVTSGIGARRWAAGLEQLTTLLAARFGVRRVLFSAVPPMHLFPALPQPLRAYLGSRARHFNEVLAAQAGLDPRCALVRFGLDGLTTASDGFHPGDAAYSAWAEALAGHVRHATTTFGGDDP